MDYPYEGDLLAIFDGVTIPKLVSESFAVVCSLVGVPAIQFQADDIFDDAWWSMRMTQTS